VTEDLPFTLPAYNIRDVERVVMSIKIDPYIKTKFQRAMKNSGTSTCGFLEPILYGSAVAIEKGIPVTTGIFTLHLTVNRITQRERRRWKRKGDDIEVVKSGSPEHCAFCGDLSHYLVTRWPSPLICQKEYVCSLHKGDLSNMVRTLGVEMLAVIPSQDFGGD